MLKFIKKFKKKFKSGSIFAFTKGLYIAKFAVLIDSSEELSFLILPDMIPYTMDKDDFYNKHRTGIIDYIEVLPDDIFSVVKAQYLKNIHAE